jgi:futalosine hydrolase
MNGDGAKAKPFNMRAGAFVTVSAVSGTLVRAEELAKKFKALCENMEGAAVAHVCRTYDIPFSEIRGISNIAGIRDKRKWKVKEAAKNSQEAVLEAIRSYDF